jgi:hypothetical protein
LSELIASPEVAALFKGKFEYLSPADDDDDDDDDDDRRKDLELYKLLHQCRL